MSNIIIGEQKPNSSYIIYAEVIAESSDSYKVSKYSTAQQTVSELVKYFRKATAELRTRRKEIFQD